MVERDDSVRLCKYTSFVEPVATKHGNSRVSNVQCAGLDIGIEIQHEAVAVRDIWWWAQGDGFQVAGVKKSHVN